MRVSKQKIELYASIRQDHRAGMSMRALEHKYGVTWRTVRNALDSRWPEPCKKLPPRLSRLDPYKPVIDEILRADPRLCAAIVDRLTFGGNIIETGSESYHLSHTKARNESSDPQ